MLYTNNYKLKKPESNDNYDIENENYNMDIIDNGICPFFAAVLDSTNVYRITTGNEITELQDGFSVKVAIPSASIGPVSLIVDGVSAVAIKKLNGSAVTNLKANGVYSLTYYNGNFILASGGGVDSDKVTASESDVLLNKTYIGSDEEIHIGNMPNNGSVSATMAINGTYIIPKGYHNGNGKITQSIPSQGATTYIPSTSDQIIYSGRYLSGNQTIKGDANLVASNIVRGKSIFGVVGTYGGEFTIMQKYQMDLGNLFNNMSITIPISYNKLLYLRKYNSELYHVVPTSKELKNVRFTLQLHYEDYNSNGKNWSYREIYYLGDIKFENINGNTKLNLYNGKIIYFTKGYMNSTGTTEEIDYSGYLRQCERIDFDPNKSYYYDLGYLN